MSLLKKFTRSNSGFTLVEVMVAAGLIGVLSLAVLQLTENIQRSSKKMSQDFNKQQLMTMISTNMMSSESCRNSFVRNDNDVSVPTEERVDPVVAPTYTSGINPQTNGANAGTDRELRDRNNRVFLSVGDKFGGNDAGAIMIEQIRLANYENGAEPFNNGAQTATLEIQIARTLTTRLEASGRTAQQIKDAEKASSLGQSRSYIRIPVKVQLLTTGPRIGQVRNCYTEFESHLETVCETSFAGEHDFPGTSRCRDIEIYKPTAGNDIAISTLGSIEVRKETAGAGRDLLAETSADGSVVMQGGLGVGFGAADSVDDDGDMIATGGLVLGGTDNPTEGVLSASRSVVAGSTTLAPATGDILATSGISAGDTTIDPPNGVIVSDQDVRVGSGISVGSKTLDVNVGDIKATGGFGTGPSLPTDIGNGDVLARDGMSVGSGATTSPGNGDLWVQNRARVGSVSASIGAGWMDVANGIYIREVQPANPGDEVVPNVRWVRTQIGRTLAPSSGEASSIAADILNAAYNETGSGLNVIKAAACTSTRIRHANGAYVYGAWVASARRCDFHTYNCSESGRCSHVYANYEVRAGRDIYAGRNLHVTSNAYAAYIRSYGNMYANGDIDADEFRARNRVCSRGYCYTMFHSAICGGRSVMVGIRNGRVICANKW